MHTHPRLNSSQPLKNKRQHFVSPSPPCSLASSNGALMSSRTHGMTGPRRAIVRFLWHDIVLCSPSVPSGRHSIHVSGPCLALTPDLPPAIFFNTRAKWEGTNHCNYVQWVGYRDDYVRYGAIMVSCQFTLHAPTSALASPTRF